jgi:hypothetical protein
LFSVPRTGDLDAGAAHINPEGTGAVSQSVSPLGAPIGGYLKSILHKPWS